MFPDSLPMAHALCPAQRKQLTAQTDTHQALKVAGTLGQEGVHDQAAHAVGADIRPAAPIGCLHGLQLGHQLVRVGPIGLPEVVPKTV